MERTCRILMLAIVRNTMLQTQEQIWDYNNKIYFREFNRDHGDFRELTAGCLDLFQ
jgi:hypothetical protein